MVSLLIEDKGMDIISPSCKDTNASNLFLSINNPFIHYHHPKVRMTINKKRYTLINKYHYIQA